MSRASAPKSKKPTRDSHEFFINQALNIPANWGVMDRREATSKILELAKMFAAEVKKTRILEEHELFHVASMLCLLAAVVGLGETEMAEGAFGKLCKKIIGKINKSRSRKKAYDMPEVYQLVADFAERGICPNF